MLTALLLPCGLDASEFSAGEATSVAHCIVGAPRVFVASCVQRAYVDHFMGGFPAHWTQHSSTVTA